MRGFKIKEGPRRSLVREVDVAKRRRPAGRCRRASFRGARRL
jgi:hypothetical protein